ncbi:hypothetical protein AB7M47_002524 [Bradyrhizobium elkanii]|jgi:hypothetical protein|nr:hypothetical protein QIH80_05075 [Bradyrhizobium elkanii]
MCRKSAQARQCKRVHRSHVHLLSDVDGGGRDVDSPNFWAVAGRPLLEHGNPPFNDEQEGLGYANRHLPIVIFLIGIVARATSPLSSSHAPMDMFFNGDCASNN